MSLRTFEKIVKVMVSMRNAFIFQMRDVLFVFETLGTIQINFIKDMCLASDICQPLII